MEHSIFGDSGSGQLSLYELRLCFSQHIQPSDEAASRWHFSLFIRSIFIDDEIPNTSDDSS